ncbi:hypothetical protein ACIRP7_45130 [Streptomyces sp. NPDC102270]|uniref:hypothetical protein n=1 Tax=Streptomyces sp. NPDC102270 TaxID=3366150 RepID=UPI0037FD1D14
MVQQERHHARNDRRTEVWLCADPNRRLYAIAARAGLRPEQILAQLANHARCNDDGTHQRAVRLGGVDLSS